MLHCESRSTGYIDIVSTTALAQSSQELSPASRPTPARVQLARICAQNSSTSSRSLLIRTPRTSHNENMPPRNLLKPAKRKPPSLATSYDLHLKRTTKR
eukprot:scaffold20136_cov70-Phaeocystis_antarctica.AAC.2